MQAVPADRPSMLSSRLKALVIPTTHRMVSGMAIGAEPGRADLDAADDQHARGHDLRDQLGMRPQMADVVDQAREEQQRCRRPRRPTSRAVGAARTQR